MWRAEIHGLRSRDGLSLKRDFSGHVIAQARRDDLESYLDLHYPASDIPKQARDLLLLSTLRLISDVNYAPVPLLALLPADANKALDMSFCVTRSTSPIHIEYLRNMGVGASLSVSIIINGELWGLIACHHCSPRYVSHAARSACDFLAHALSILVAGREQEAEFKYADRLNKSQYLLNQAIASSPDFGHACRKWTAVPSAASEADGAALVMSGVVCLKSQTPSESVVLQLANHFWDHVPEDVWSTDRFLETMPAAASFTPEVCGVLAARLSRETRGYLFWFRVEVAHTVKWAGDPALSKSADPASGRLSPRKSFALWQQRVSGRSKYWLASEISAAKLMRYSYQELYATQTRTLVLLNHRDQAPQQAPVRPRHPELASRRQSALRPSNKNSPAKPHLWGGNSTPLRLP
jgi:light-regulated signal transduction histidine kinase (bacteriophytochrome)